MIKIEFYNPHDFDIDEGDIGCEIDEILKSKKVTHASVVVAVVNKREMLEYSELYYGDKKSHPVFSFPNREITQEFIEPLTGVEDLGEIILNYDFKGKKSLVKWAAHGALHLVGTHHK